MHRSPARFRPARALIGVAVPVVLLAALASGPAGAAPATAVSPLSVTNPTNPLANLTWGHDTGTVNDGTYPAYQAATGINKTRLGRVALRPRVHWFGAWNSNASVAKTVRTYIANVTGGSSTAVAQMALFRLSPWEGGACHHTYTTAEQNSYKQWIDQVAGAIGTSHVAVILQPDLPFAYCANNYVQPASLVNYAAKELSHLAHTAVYIDAGAADWYSAGQAALLLRYAGVAYVRGFALNATHYDSNVDQIMYGAKIVAALNTVGNPALKNKHFVVSTAQNGRAFTSQQFKHDHPTLDYNNAPACQTSTQLRCVTLGIPPTYNVGETRWPIGDTARRIAVYDVDGFLWIGRPWLLGKQFSPTKTFNLDRTLTIARTTPWWNLPVTTMP